MGNGAGDMKQHLEQIDRMKEVVAQADPAFLDAYSEFSQQAKKPGVLSPKEKELICVALGIAAHCTFCIASHVNKAIEAGASRAEIMEAGFVAALMGGGPSMAYLTHVIDACDELGAK